MSRPLPTSATLLGQGFLFILQTVVPAAPPALWWSMSLGLFSFLNLVLQREIWPHTPPAESWFLLLSICCVVLLPWQVARTAGRVAEALRGSGWRFLWRLASWGAYVAGGLAVVPGAIGAGYLLISLFSR